MSSTSANDREVSPTRDQETSEIVAYIKSISANILSQEELNKKAVTILRKTTEEARGAFQGSVVTVKLFVELSRVITVHPLGPEAFGECVHQLTNDHNPFDISNRTHVSVAFESTHSAVPLASFFKSLNEITPETIVDCLAESDQCLELDIPRVSIIFTYIRSPF
ncbi:hypothetical protein GCK72_021643 [Caenorhabditis remanei]|uniref:Uncharacterized protein n=1 Tax=Caenorhabditis remanei TaxID=31234 RepID=A0A6A5GKL8_CAERE|nr:hypothetical protein GCK72_021643 [Caenorhabditis remanei]KAF1755075.1 hypothetical protein GCK72_021643 [Caenorhabditis remanei]